MEGIKETLKEHRSATGPEKSKRCDDGYFNEEFANLIRRGYKLLTGYGMKSVIQIELQNYTKPPRTLAVIRGYFHNPMVVSITARWYYFPLMAHLVIYHVNQQRDEFENSPGDVVIDEILNKLQTLLNELPDEYKKQITETKA